MSNSATLSKTTTNLGKSTMTDLMTNSVVTPINTISLITDTKTTETLAAPTPLKDSTSIAPGTTTIKGNKTTGHLLIVNSPLITSLSTEETTNTQDRDQTTT
jgi:hypothetical protein